MRGSNTIKQAFQQQINAEPFVTKHVSVNAAHNDGFIDLEAGNLLNLNDFGDKKTLDLNETEDNDSIYANITSSPRKKQIFSPKKKVVEEKEPLSKLIENGNNLLKSIITTLSNPGTYQMSDWEDDGAMLDEDIDQECETFDGKKIPSWALVEPLKKSISKQKQSDGDCIFANLPRRCNLEAVFGTKSIPYYMKQKK